MFTIKKSSLSYRFLTLIDPNFRKYHKLKQNAWGLPRTFCGYYWNLLQWIFVALLGIFAATGAIFFLAIVCNKEFHSLVYQFGQKSTVHLFEMMMWSAAGLFLLLGVGIYVFVNVVTFIIGAIVVLWQEHNVTERIVKLWTNRPKFQKKADVDSKSSFWQNVREVYRNKVCPFVEYEDHHE